MAAPTSPKLNLEQLLRLGVSAARAGNRSSARALFLALTREYPAEVRPWLGLAGVAADADERRTALEHVIAIDPDNPQAAQALARLAPAALPVPPPAFIEAPTDGYTEPPPPLAAPALGLAPSELAAEQDAPPVGAGRFPLLNRIALALIAALLIALLIMGVGLLRPAAGGQTATAPPRPLLQADAPDPTAAELPPAGTALGQPAAAPTASDLAASLTSPTAGAVATRPASLTGTPSTPPSPLLATGTAAPADLPLGSLIEVDGWSATLLQPEYALVLDGSVGDLRPSGRFVLALIAISNNSAVERRIPADLFLLADRRGRRYSPVPNVSTVYLTLYGRGQRGDLAFEDPLGPQSGMRSVPILFDVPADAANLVLLVKGGGPAGWPVGQPAAAPGNVGP